MEELEENLICVLIFFFKSAKEHLDKSDAF